MSKPLLISTLKLLVLPSVLVFSSHVLIGCESMSMNANNTITVQKSIQKSSNQTLPLTKEMLSHYSWKLASATDAHNHSINKVEDHKEKANLSFSIIDDNSLTISFNIGCNTFGGTSRLDTTQQTLTNGMMLATRMYCDTLNAAEGSLSNLMAGSSVLTLIEADRETPILLKQTTTNKDILVWYGLDKD